MSQISTFWTEIQGCHLTRLVWRTRIIFRFFSYVAIAHLLRRGEYVGIWFRIPLMKSSHKWAQMLFIISNSKLGIWLCSQPRIDLNSQSNFYGVLTRPYTYLSNTISTLSTKQHALNTIYMLVSPVFSRLPSLLDSAAEAATEAIVSSEAPSISIRKMRWRLMMGDRGGGGGFIFRWHRHQCHHFLSHHLRWAATEYIVGGGQARILDGVWLQDTGGGWRCWRLWHQCLPLTPLPLKPLLLTPSLPLEPLPMTPPPLLLMSSLDNDCATPLMVAAETMVENWDNAGAEDNGGRRIFVSLIYRLRWEMKVSLIIIILQPIIDQYPSLAHQYKRVTFPLCQFLLIYPTVPWIVYFYHIFCQKHQFILAPSRVLYWNIQYSSMS